MSRTFVVTAERSHGVWVLEAPEVGAVSQCRRLDQVADEMREAIAHLSGLAESDVEIEVRPTLPVEYLTAAAEAEALRHAEAQMRQDAAAAARRAAKSLIDAGLSMRDAAIVMGVSHQRVAQLAVGRLSHDRSGWGTPHQASRAARMSSGTSKFA